MSDQSPDDKKKKLGIAIAVGPANKVAPPKSPFGPSGQDDDGDNDAPSAKGASVAPDGDVDDDMGAKLDAITAQLSLITNALGLSAGAHQPDQSIPQGDDASSPFGGAAQPAGGGPGPYGQ